MLELAEEESSGFMVYGLGFRVFRVTKDLSSRPEFPSEMYFCPRLTPKAAVAVLTSSRDTAKILLNVH